MTTHSQDSTHAGIASGVIFNAQGELHVSATGMPCPCVASAQTPPEASEHDLAPWSGHKRPHMALSRARLWHDAICSAGRTLHAAIFALSAPRWASLQPHLQSLRSRSTRVCALHQKAPKWASILCRIFQKVTGCHNREMIGITYFPCEFLTAGYCLAEAVIRVCVHIYTLCDLFPATFLLLSSL